MSKDWGYDETNGPAIWHKLFPQAGGSRQSPVDIVTALATSDDSLKNAPLSWEYNPEKCTAVANPGYCWRVDVDGEDSELIGGPLTGKYRLEQFHCHWGPESSQGSEHTVDGKAYAGELHLVHWNESVYPTFKEAAAAHDGLAVLGIFLEVGPEDHPEIEKVVTLIDNIMFKGQSSDLPFPIDPSKFLPDDSSYWTYLGSLTTPPCSESVIWILFKQAIQVSERQLDAFRSLRCCEPERTVSLNAEGKVLQNYRPPLPLGNRLLRECGSL